MAKMFLVNPYRLRSGSAKSRHYAGRGSFSGQGVTTMSRRKSRGVRHRRNPFGLDSSVVKTAAWAVAGGVGTRSLPEMILPAQNTGFTGYALNVAAAVVLSMLGNRFIGGEAGKGILIGGIAGTGMRIVEEQFGRRLGEFSSISSLAGDPRYSFMGAYDAASFPLPWNGAALPPAAIAAVQASNPADF